MEEIKSTGSINPMRLSTCFNSNQIQSLPPNILMNQITQNCSVPNLAEVLKYMATTGQNQYMHYFNPSEHNQTTI